jgi:hypothetical protein
VVFEKVFHNNFRSRSHLNLINLNLLQWNVQNPKALLKNSLSKSLVPPNTAFTYLANNLLTFFINFFHSKLNFIFLTPLEFSYFTIQSFSIFIFLVELQSFFISLLFLFISFLFYLKFFLNLVQMPWFLISLILDLSFFVILI